MQTATGLVLKRYSGFYYVQDESNRILECKLRGKVKNLVILTGDRVRVTLTEPGKGIIEAVMPRTTEMIRPRVANVDLILVVMSFALPSPNIRLLDRLLVLIEHQGLFASIILNKCDLESNQVIEIIKGYYPTIGYPVLLTSVKTGEGLDELIRYISGHIAVLSGPSGVGKSSLLNLMLPDQAYAETGEVSQKIGRGRHTTRHVELYPLPGEGWIADTPGFSSIDVPVMKREELSRLFPDFVPLIEECGFNDCIHWKEDECRVKEALERGEIPRFRYESYLSLLDEVIQKERSYR